MFELDGCVCDDKVDMYDYVFVFLVLFWFYCVVLEEKFWVFVDCIVEFMG